MGNKGRLKDCGPGQERRERYLDPKGQDKSLEGIRLDVKEKVLAPAGTQAGDSQERQAVNSQILARAADEGLCCWRTGGRPSQGTPGQAGHGETRGCPIPGPRGLEAGAPQEALGALSCLIQQRGRGAGHALPPLA